MNATPAVFVIDVADFSRIKATLITALVHLVYLSPWWCLFGAHSPSVMPAAMSRFRRISNRGTGCLNMFKCLLLASIFSVTLRVICTFVSPLKRESDIPVSSSSSSSALLLASSEWSLDHWRGQSALASYVLWQVRLCVRGPCSHGLQRWVATVSSGFIQMKSRNEWDTNAYTYRHQLSSMHAYEMYYIVFRFSS